MKWQAFRLRALWCWHQLLTLGLGLLVVLAAMVGVSRELFPLADRYRPELESALSTRLGVPVTLQKLEGEADGVQLRLRLLRLELHDPAARSNVLLRIPEVELRPAIWQSLRHAELRVDVRLRGLDIHFDQQPDGRFQLRELAGLARHDATTAAQTVGFVLRQPALALSESRVGVTLQQYPGLTFSGIDLINRNEGDSHRLAARLRLAGVSQELTLQMDYDGDPLQWGRSHLKAYVHLPVLTLDSWLPGMVEVTPGLSQLKGGGSYWLDFRNGRLTAMQAQIDWRELVLQQGENRHRFRNMHGLLSWQRAAGSWQLAGQRLYGEVDDLPWPLPNLALRTSGETLTVAAARSNVAGVGKLLLSLPVAESLRDWLREALPSGEVTSLQADLAALPQGGWRLRRLDAEGRRLSARATATHPGANNLNGWLRWTPDQAWLGLDSQNAELGLPRLLHEPVPVRDLRGQLRLSREGGAWRLDSDRLQLVNADMKAAAVVTALIPEQDPHAVRLSLLGSLSQARAASAWRYLPWPTVSEHTIDWLRHSLVAGTVTQGEFAYEGPMHPEPELDPGRLLLHFTLQKARLDYAADWPEVRDLDGEVTLDGHHLEAYASNVHLLDGSQGRAVNVGIADLRDPLLQVSADVTSNGADLGRLFRESPLKAHTGGLTDTIALSGPLQGHLTLALPLHGGEPEVEATAQLQDNQLYVKPARLTASRLRGELRYATATGLQAPRLEALLLEAPVQASIQTEPGARRNIVVNLAGRAEVPALRRWLASSLLDVASGGVAYQARLNLPAGGEPRLQVDSSLAGLRLNLPPPLGKGVNEMVPLRYQLALGGKEQQGRLQYGQRLAGGLVWDGNRLDRALLRLNSTSAAWPQAAGLEIEGRLPRLDFGDWKPWLAQFQRPGRAVTVTARGEAPMPALTRLDLDVRELLAEGWRLRNAHIGLARDAAAWRLAVDSDELAGRAQFPDEPGSPVSLSFSRLQWPLPQAAVPATASAGLNPVAGLGNRPLLVEGEGLRLAAWPGLGPLGVNARVLPIPYGLRVENLELRSPILGFKGLLDWQWRGGVSSHLQGQAASTNLAGLLAGLGYAPTVVAKNATVDLDLAWRGSPDRVALDGLDGQMRVVLESGRILNVSTGTSVSRIFGWFDLDNLQRRLKGDFSDMLRRGLAFDRVSLEGPLQAGVMQPAALAVTGPTLQAQGQGRLDIGKKKLDQELIVTVPVTSAVPIAAVVMAGPVVGGAVAAAQMAFEKQIDRVTQMHYRISGDWASLRVEKLSTKGAGQAPVNNKTAGNSNAGALGRGGE